MSPEQKYLSNTRMERRVLDGLSVPIPYKLVRFTSTERLVHDRKLQWILLRSRFPMPPFSF